MNRVALKKRLSWVLAVALAAVVGSLGWADHQLRRFSGAFTEVVDRAQFQSPLRPTAIINVNTLSPDGSQMIPGGTVLLDNGRIVSVNQGSDLPRDVLTIDGTGLYLIPGLVDTHVHLRQSPNDLLLYLVNGVTYICEMSGNADHLAWRHDTEGGLLGPRMFIASEKLGSWGWLDGQWQRWTRNRIDAGGPEEVGALVQALADDGYDAVKLGSFLDSGTYHAVFAAARTAGIPVLGHVEVSLNELWSSGQKQLAHLEELVEPLNAEFGYFNSRNADDFLAFVARRSEDVAERLHANKIAVSTTLWLVQSIPAQKFHLDSLLQKVELSYANPGLVEGTPLSPGWLPGNNPYDISPGVDSAGRAALRRYWTAYLEAHRIVLNALVARGVTVMAGTDADNAVVVPGFSLHDEMKVLVDAGMTPAQSLLSATAVPGEWMGSETGRIAPGYRADLVLLKRNPLENIENTRSIEAVIIGGRVVNRAQLDAMRNAVKEANDQSRSLDIRGLLPVPAPAPR